ncbi:PmeII family type II restriction endonuclease [Caldithrix abyssi]
MTRTIKNEVVKYVAEHIGEFHAKRIENLKNLKLKKVLRRKNPYLFKAKYLLTAEQIIKSLVDAHLSSNEETLFGDWLEGLAIFVNGIAYGGWKSGISGIDLEFNHNHIRYIVAIKSGPNWGSQSQKEKLKDCFRKAKITLRTSKSGLNVVAVNGCCYGKSKKVDYGDYFFYCGQRFWEFISGEKELYKELIEPLGYKAKDKNEEFFLEYARMINRFTMEFSRDFCLRSGEIDWQKLLEFNSGYED